jgi:hypothetical protein
VEDREDNQIPNSFLIVSTQKSFVVIAETNAQKQEWVSDILIISLLLPCSAVVMRIELTNFKHTNSNPTNADTKGKFQELNR